MLVQSMRNFPVARFERFHQGLEILTIAHDQLAVDPDDGHSHDVLVKPMISLR
ncbi:MAG: hypothetical protein R2882_12770 [Gemmatimonadales bacterium]